MQLCPGCGSSVAGDATDCPICNMSLGPVSVAEERSGLDSSADRLGNDALRVAPDIPLPGDPTPLDQLEALPIVRKNRQGIFADPVTGKSKSNTRAPRPPAKPRGSSLPGLQGPPVPPASTKVSTGPLPVDPLATQDATPPADAAPKAGRSPATQPAKAAAPKAAPRPPAPSPPSVPPSTPISRTARASITTATGNRVVQTGVPVLLVVMVMVVICLYVALLDAGRTHMLGPVTKADIQAARKAVGKPAKPEHHTTKPSPK